MATKKVATNTDEAALSLLRDIARRKKEINQAETGKVRTPGVVTLYGVQHNVLVVPSSDDISNLILITAMLRRLEEDYAQASTVLGVERPPELKLNGFTVADWLHDVQLRVTKHQLRAKREKLAALEARASAILTPETKARLELEALQAELEG